MNDAIRALADDETTVLIVSAHRQLRTHYASILDRLDIKLALVSDAFEALDYLRNNPVHAILSDCILPGISAIDLFLHMKVHHHPIPLVLCSPDLDEQFRDDVLKIGVFKIVKSPLRTAELLTTIELALEERQRQVLQFFC